MRVYLRSDSYYMHIGNVVLHEGYLPSVGVEAINNKHLLSRRVLEDLEPAVWFKVITHNT